METSTQGRNSGSVRELCFQRRHQREAVRANADSNRSRYACHRVVKTRTSSPEFRVLLSHWENIRQSLIFKTDKLTKQKWNKNQERPKPRGAQGDTSKSKRENTRRIRASGFTRGSPGYQATPERVKSTELGQYCELNLLRKAYPLASLQGWLSRAPVITDSGTEGCRPRANKLPWPSILSPL